jgi:ATP-dependent RNA helicase DDX35
MLGTVVGYAIQFDDKSSQEHTRIKYMTDGMLFRETLSDPLLSKYSVIMVDKAHERTLYTDLLLAVLKNIMKQRTDLKLIIASATMDNAATFLDYFSTGAILSIQARSHPVDVHFLQEPCNNYVDKAVDVVFQIHALEPPGDVLVFLTGSEEIEQALGSITMRASRYHHHTNLTGIGYRTT